MYISQSYRLCIFKQELHEQMLKQADSVFAHISLFCAIQLCNTMVIMFTLHSFASLGTRLHNTYPVLKHARTFGVCRSRT